MNQAYKEALAIVVRQALIGIGTALGISGTLTPYLGELTNHIVAGLLVAVGTGYAQVVQWYKRRKLMQALQEANMTEAEAARMVRSTLIATPPVTTSPHEVPNSAPRGNL